jgi:hypothetical protein
MVGVYAISAGRGSDMGRVQRAVRDQVSFWQGPRDDRPRESIQCAAVMLSYCRILHYGCTALLYCYQGARRHAWAWGGSVRWLGAWCLVLVLVADACSADVRLQPPVQHAPFHLHHHQPSPQCRSQRCIPVPGCVLSWARCTAIPLSPKTSATLTRLRWDPPRSLARCR